MTLLAHRLRRCLSRAALLVLALPVAGCSWFGTSYRDVKCPSTDIVGELGSVSRVRGQSGNFADMSYHATLTGLSGTCDIDDAGVTVKLSVTVLGEIGPAAALRTADFPYFIAITGPNDRVLFKQVMDNNLNFGSNQRAGATDSLVQHVPLRNPRDADKIHVMLGFQLTQDELAYNRSHGDH